MDDDHADETLRILETELAKMDIESQPQPLTDEQRSWRVMGALLEGGVPLDAVLAKAGLRLVPIDA